MVGRIASGVGSASMAVVVLVLAHNMVFLAGYGAAYGRALASTGHDHGWTAAMLIVIGLASGLLIAAASRLWRLDLLTGGAGALTPVEPDRRGLVRRWLRLSSWLAPVTALLFVIQENIERLQAGLPLPGLGVLTITRLPTTPLIICVVALLVAIVGALYQWRRDVLVARIRAATLGRHRIVARSVRARGAMDRRPESVLGRESGLRAPPFAFDP